jgi:TPR repeat protein
MKLSNIVECAENGDPIFQFLLGVLQAHQIGSSGHGDTSIDWVRRAAEQGCRQAAYALYFLLRKQDPHDAAAFEWLRKSAATGFAPAQFLIGVSYHWGSDVEKNLNQAMTWIKLSADQGYVQAIHHLASMYFDGADVAQDRELARQLFRGAALRGYPPSAHMLGLDLIETKDQSNVKEGFSLIMTAAASDHYASNFFLSNAYRTGRYGVPKDAGLAEMFRIRAERLQKKSD